MTTVPSAIVMASLVNMGARNSGLNLRRNDGLREYARLEYKTPDAAWLLAAVGRVPRKPRRKVPLARRLRGILSGRAAPKGFPRLPEECPAKA